MCVCLSLCPACRLLDKVTGVHRVGKEAAVAMPHWLLLFLAIMM